MTTPAPPLPASPIDGNDPLALAAYNQNWETFRSLNALMWQVPLIAMTLTGGLWFGVASIAKDSGLSILRPSLLLLAGIGDVLLVVILERLRHLIAGYLSWLSAAHPSGFVAADGTGFKSRKVVKTCFQIMLGFAAVTSFVLFVASMAAPSSTKPRSITAWYDTHARELADGYEGLDAATAHPQLFKILRGASGAKVLDIGAGTGRDAAAIAALGHEVTAVEPSKAMLRLAKGLHPDNDVRWLSDSMPALAKVAGTYDIVVLSAVWMHVPPSERPAAFSRLVDLLSPEGQIYLTLRLGPGDVERSMWSVSAEEITWLAAARGMKIIDHGKQPDLMGRDDVRWQTLVVMRSDPRQ